MVLNMNSKKIFYLTLIFILFAGLSFVSATNTDNSHNGKFTDQSIDNIVDYNHDGKVNEIDSIDYTIDSIDNVADYNHDGKVDVNDAFDKVIDSVDKKVNDDNSFDIQDTENNAKLI